MTIDYAEAAKGDSFPVFKAGTYVCRIIDAKHKPDNEYQGTAAPCWSLLVQPLKDIQRPEMMDTADKPIVSTYQDKEGNTRERYLFVNLGIPLKLHAKSNFGKLCKAIFDTEDYTKYTYQTVEEFIGNTVTCAISVTKKQDGSLKNKIESMSNDPNNKIVKAGEERKLVESVFNEAPAEVSQEVKAAAAVADETIKADAAATAEKMKDNPFA